MQLWGGSLLCFMGLALVARWCFLRRPDWQVKLLSIRLEAFLNQTSRGRKTARRLLKRIYSCIQLSIAKNDHISAYRTVDLLKLALGEGLGGADAGRRLTALAVAALRTDQADVAAYILDAYKPLLRNLQCSERIVVVEQQTLIALVAFKTKNKFMLAKIVDNILQIFGQSTEWPLRLAALRSLKALGQMALRRRDEALFREIVLKLSNCDHNDQLLVSQIIALSTYWLHRIIKSDSDTLLAVLLPLSRQYLQAAAMDEQTVVALAAEWESLAGEAALNPYSQLAPTLIDFWLATAAARSDERVWLAAVMAAAKTVRLAVSQHGLEGGFKTWYPLLDAGRRLLSAELKFQHTTDQLRQKVLFFVVKECMMLVSLLARTDMTSSAGDMIARLYQHWSAYPARRGSDKSLKKFCQILLLYWRQVKQRQARRECGQQYDFNEPMLITQLEKDKLGLTYK